MLTITDLETGYGKRQVLFGVSLDVQQGDIVALIGPNGAGKSTVLKSVCGLIPSWTGEICFNGSVLGNSIPADRVAKGLTFAPQGSRVFHDLTVYENLEIGGIRLPRRVVKERIEYLLNFFPAIKDKIKRDAGNLSGGEQQMLALARALVPRPKLLMLDEPSLGLSPSLVKNIFEKIVEINREDGVTILVVEQKVREILEICTQVYSLKMGKIAFDGLPDDLRQDKAKLRQLFL